MTNPQREVWLGWQGQVAGKQHPRGWDFQGKQLGGEDCPGLWGHTAGTPAGANIASGGI